MSTTITFGTFVSDPRLIPHKGVRIGEYVITFIKKDRSDRRAINAKSRVYGACDDLVADLNALEPPYVYSTNESSPATEIVAEKMWRTWRDATKKVAGQRLVEMLGHITEDNPALVGRGIGVRASAIEGVKFSYKAGCSMCPCSPGFILGDRVFVDGWAVDLWVSSAETMKLVVETGKVEAA